MSRCLLPGFARTCVARGDRGLDYSAPGICAHLSAENGGEPVEVPDYRPQ